MADFNILTPENLNELIYSPFSQAIGESEHQRLQKQYRNYLYYDGYQHKGASDELVKAEDVPRPAGLDYDPTRYVSNYARLLVKKKANWQMNGEQGIDVPIKRIDPSDDIYKADYKPSVEQQREYDRAEALEAIITQLRRENNAKARLIQAARDRLIAGRVAVKILFNPNTGKLKWAWHSDTETFPVFSEDDFGELLAVSFITERKDDGGKLIYRKQTFEMIDGECYLSEGEYDEALELVRTITPQATMGLTFIPVVLIPIEDLAGEPALSKEFDDIMALSAILNQMNEDAIDSLKFEMFGVMALINAAPGTTEKMEIAAGALVAINGNGDNTPDLKKVEGGFRWNQAFDSQYNRVKSAMHELTAIPQSNLADLNFGGMNNDAMHIVFHDIIQDTEEHWLSWGPRLVDLHEKSIRYLQARTTSKSFGYDREKLALIGDNYEHEIKFALPLPDNRADLIELLTLEMASGLESQSGALTRAGVENTAGKKAEIQAERVRLQAQQDPYGTMPE